MYKEYSFLAVITARGGSKGLPRKNILTLGDKPLIAWSIECGLKSKYIDKVIVSTDDSEIATSSEKHGAIVPFIRPEYLSQDGSSSADVVEHAIIEYEKQSKKTFDYIVLLQPTSPFRTYLQLDEAIESIINNKQRFDSLISLTEIDYPIYWTRKISQGYVNVAIDYDKKKQFQRQAFEKLYRTNGAIYIIEKKVFLEKKLFETDKTMPYLMSKETSIDIDHQSDLDYANYTIIKMQK